MAEPWERQPGESEAAYAAFRAFLQLGAERTVRAAYRQASGKAEASQVPGYWSKWVSEHRWAERALAWDQRAGAVHQEAVERAIAKGAAEWVRRRDEQHHLEYQLGRRLMKRADQLASFPVTRETVDDDGRPITVEPAEPGMLKAAAVIAREGSALARSAIAAALEYALPAVAAEDPQGEDPAMSLDRATRKLEAWRAEQRRAILAIPPEPPGAPGEPQTPAPAGA